MKQLNLLEIETRWGYKTFELYQGDITALEFPVDVLAVSSFYGNYAPVAKTVIGALHDNCGVEVGELARRPEFNLKDVFNCWVARLPGDGKFRRVLCVEFADGDEPREVIENLFVTLSVLEVKGIKVGTLALPILGTGNQVLSPEKIIKALLDSAQKYMNRSQTLKRIVFVEINKERARQLDKAMNDALGRVKVVMPKGALSEQLRKEIGEKVEAAAALAGPKGHEVFSDLRRLIGSGQSRSFEIGIVSRRLVEFVADDLLRKSKKGFDLYRKIDSLSERGVADWVRSYMHVLRILGNESAHEKDRGDRVPANIEEDDLTLCFFCLQRVLDFWVTLNGASDAARS
jgi:O-acetyl-ADP-ribose deacetylase (regulator of RNase III)